ncbi:MAG: hypothetical protein IMY76_07375 [Chloroflexi bacterium]|nr:hypothetical protein [Chloroflexota bacterium]
MKGQWAMTYITHQIPELKSEPIRIWFHIVAEMVTAISLITGGIGLLMQMDWGKNIFLISIGMLFYTSIVSPGYFAQKGQWIWLAMFAAVMLLGIVSLFLVL